MTAYYNEHDPKAAAWLRELIDAGLVAKGDVDERDIRDVLPAELVGYTQCHFFAGIGGWSRALRLAGWPDDRRVWTGSCPCQSFSAAGQRKGFADERHLWPSWFHLISECQPDVILGEQVASKDALEWYDFVHADLEAIGYAVGAVDLPAACHAPHIRQRLWFVAESVSNGSGSRGPGPTSTAADRVQGANWERKRVRLDTRPSGTALVGTLDDTAEPRLQGLPRIAGDRSGRIRGESSERRGNGFRPGSDAGFWRDPDWLLCTDGKWRPVESGSFPLAHGIPGRVGLLRGYGNAIVPQIAAEVIAAYRDCRGIVPCPV